VALHADEIDPLDELVRVSTETCTACAQPRVMRPHPCLHARPRPGDVAVLEQRYQVVADGTAQGVLEVDDPGVARLEQHQVAGMIVAVHEHLRLRKRRADQELAGIRNNGPLLLRQLQSKVARAEPLRHERHLALERSAVIGVELRGGRRAFGLDLREHIERIGVQRLGIVPGREPREIQRRAQILDEQQPARRVHLVHVRHVDPEGLEHPTHGEIRAHVLVCRRRIHHDVGAACGKCAEIAPKAGVARGRLEALRGELEIAREPLVDQCEARIGLRHECGAELLGFRRRGVRARHYNPGLHAAFAPIAAVVRAVTPAPALQPRRAARKRPGPRR